MSNWDDPHGIWKKEKKSSSNTPIYLILISGFVVSFLICCIAFASVTPPNNKSSPQLEFTNSLPSDLSTVTPTSLSPSTSLPPTASPPTPVNSKRIQPSPLQPDKLDGLRALMLEAINTDRMAHNLKPVLRDDTATLTGQLHVEDMAANDFFSHWNMSGYGPDHRYSAMGGLDAVAENIHTYWSRFDDGSPVPIDDWAAIIKQAQNSLMNSPGHRRNILDPAHTHVGVGIAYNPELGQIWIAQEFVNRYARLKPLPKTLPLGANYQLQGQLLPGAGDPLINLAYEPFSRPMSKAELAQTSSYQSAAEIFQPVNPAVDASGRFTARLIFDNEGQTGLYHVLVWVDHSDFSDKILASDVIVEVR